MTRFAAIALCLFVAAQSTAFAGTRMVCRYSGKEMKGCSAQPGAQPLVEKAGCCTMLQSDAAPVASASRESAQVRTVDLAVVLPSIVRVEPPRAALRVPSGDEPPPLRSRYLTLRQLLL
jgi:hypothetical protein